RKPSMAWDDHRATFHVVGGYGHLSQAVQALEHSLQASSAFQVDDGVFRRIENVARADGIRAPEKDDAVAIRSPRLMKYLHGFTVEIEVLLRHRIRVVWPRSFRYRRFGVGIAHPVQNRAKRNDENARLRSAGNGQGTADLREILVAAYMIGSVVGIDDVSDLTL